MPTSTRGSPTSAAAGRSSRCARPFTPRRRHRGRAMITRTPKIDRRSFVIGTAAVGAGLTLGLRIPFGTSVVRAQDGSPELNAWVVIRPDDTVVVRIARSEMGQGTLTGLAQMVVEELEADWKKVSPERITPGMNLARKRVWGDMSTGGGPRRPGPHGCFLPRGGRRRRGRAREA